MIAYDDRFHEAWIIKWPAVSACKKTFRYSAIVRWDSHPDSGHKRSIDFSRSTSRTLEATGWLEILVISASTRSKSRVRPTCHSGDWYPLPDALRTSGGSRSDSAALASGRRALAFRSMSDGNERQNSISRTSAVGSRLSIPHPPRIPFRCSPKSIWE